MLNNKNLFYCGFLVVYLLFSITALSQETSPTPTEEERRLEDRKRILTLQKDIAEAQKAIRDAQLKPSSTPLGGNAEIENVKIESQIVTYQAMSNLLNEVVTEINTKVPNAKVFVIYDPQEVKNLSFYLTNKNATTAKIDNYTQYYQLIITEICSKVSSQCSEAASENKNYQKLDLVSGVPLVATTLGLLADAVSFLRTDTKITGVDVKIEDDALNTEIFRKLTTIYKDKGNDIKFVYSGNYPIFTSKINSCFSKSNNSDCPQILSQLTMLSKLYNISEKIVFTYSDENTLNLERINDEIETEKKKITSLEEKILKLKVNALEATPKNQQIIVKNIVLYESEIDQINTQLKALRSSQRENLRTRFLLNALSKQNESVKDFVSSFSSSGDDSSSKLLSYLRGERLADLFSNNESYWLEMKNLVAGGNNRTRKNLIRYIFGAKIDHSGGIIISWKLYDENAQLTDGDVKARYEGYISSKSIRKKY